MRHIISLYGCVGNNSLSIYDNHGWVSGNLSAVAISTGNLTIKLSTYLSKSLTVYNIELRAFKIAELSFNDICLRLLGKS